MTFLRSPVYGFSLLLHYSRVPVVNGWLDVSVKLVLNISNTNCRECTDFSETVDKNDVMSMIEDGPSDV